MLEYGQFCPVSKAAEILGEKWTLLIVRELLLGSTRFSQLQRAMSRISPTVLNKRLDSLQRAGLIVRKRIPGQRGYEYHLTEAGRELFPIVLQIAKWGMRWARGQMSNSELDVNLLMMDIERRLDTSKLPGGQTILQFRFTDLKRYGEWWIKIKGDDVDLCTENPGHDVDVYFTTDLRTMTEVWMGDISVKQAQSEKRLKIVGPSVYLKNLQSWLGLYLFSEIRPAGDPGSPSVRGRIE
jgi:DNA-binding HxlR family transcriptional regulator